MELKPILIALPFVGFYLLIVPYGIETTIRCMNKVLKQAFNCTLWNWNEDETIEEGSDGSF